MARAQLKLVPAEPAKAVPAKPAKAVQIGSGLIRYSRTWKSGCECPRCEGQRWTVGRIIAECFDCGVLLPIRETVR